MLACLVCLFEQSLFASRCFCYSPAPYAFQKNHPSLLAFHSRRANNIKATCGQRKNTARAMDERWKNTAAQGGVGCGGHKHSYIQSCGLQRPLETTPNTGPALTDDPGSGGNGRHPTPITVVVKGKKGGSAVGSVGVSTRPNTTKEKKRKERP